MYLVFLIASIALALGVLGYTAITHYSTSKAVKGTTLIIAAIVTVPLLGLAVFVLLSDQYDTATEIWSMATAALVVGFWFKNPFRDFSQTS